MSSYTIAWCEDEVPTKYCWSETLRVQLGTMAQPWLILRLRARHELEFLKTFWSICYTITAWFATSNGTHLAIYLTR